MRAATAGLLVVLHHGRGGLRGATLAGHWPVVSPREPLTSATQHCHAEHFSPALFGRWLGHDARARCWDQKCVDSRARTATAAAHS